MIRFDGVHYRRDIGRRKVAGQEATYPQGGHT